jgi:hypothetical protein
VAFASCPALTELGRAGMSDQDDWTVRLRTDPDLVSALTPGPAGAGPTDAAPVRDLSTLGSRIYRVSGTTASLSRALGRALEARTGLGPTVRRPDPGLAVALDAYDIESIAARMAQLYRELLGPSEDGLTAPDNHEFSQIRTVGVHHV